MFVTGLRQMRFAWSALSGRPQRVSDVVALVDDTRATLAKFGTPGAGASDLLAPPPDPELQTDLANRRVRATIRRAAREVPYYRWWFDAHGLDPDAVTATTLAAIRPTPKDALCGMPGAFVANTAEPALAAQTTGTTGTPTMVWFSHREMEVFAGLSALALMLVNGLRSHHVWANCISSRSIAQPIMTRAVGMTGAAFLPLGLIHPGQALDRIATPVHLPGKEPRVTHLNTPPSYLAALVQEAERNGWSPADFGLEAIHVGGEVLTKALVRRAEEIFGAPVIDGYSMTEIMPVAGQHCARGHLHVAADQGYVEVLDPDSHMPAAPGAVGVLTVTPYLMYRQTTMLLRYSTGDLVRVLPDDKELDCELAGVPATSPILGKQTTSALTTRDLLEVLQAERQLPLPTRYALTDTAAGTMLHVFAGTANRSLLTRLEARVADAALPLAGIVLAEDATELPALCPVRADLREQTFTRSGREPHAGAEESAAAVFPGSNR